MFPRTFSYNHFIEVVSRCFVAMTMFLKLALFGKCTCISFLIAHVYQSYITSDFSAWKFSKILLPGGKHHGMVHRVQITSVVQWKRWDNKLQPSESQCRQLVMKMLWMLWQTRHMENYMQTRAIFLKHFFRAICLYAAFKSTCKFTPTSLIQ